MIQDPQHALDPGLYFVATPIGAARDITLRTLDILRCCDVIAAEDTRALRHLMHLHGIPSGGRTIIAYHDHNGPQTRPKIIAALHAGKSVAFAPQAGTPLLADPGYQLARVAIDNNIHVSAAPGPSAALMGLVVSGLPSDRFLFAGFPPAKQGDRARWLAEIEHIPATLILYESPKRINRLLTEICNTWDVTRPAAVCRELTKRFEEVRRDTLGALLDSLHNRPLKGEIVLLIGRSKKLDIPETDLDAALRHALQNAPLKEASANVAVRLGLPKRQVYQRALYLKDKA